MTPHWWCNWSRNESTFCSRLPAVQRLRLSLWLASTALVQSWEMQGARLILGCRFWAMCTPFVFFGTKHIQISPCQCVDASELLWKYAGFHCLGCMHIFSLLLYWISMLGQSPQQTMGPGQSCRVQEHAPHPSYHRTGAGGAHDLSPWYYHTIM